MGGVWTMFLAPIFIWMWRGELVNLVSDMIAEHHPDKVRQRDAE